LSHDEKLTHCARNRRAHDGATNWIWFSGASGIERDGVCLKRECEVTLRMETLGWAGTALVIVAYIPQIHHLYVERCAWGISISTWLIWLVAGALLLSYSIFRNDTLFTFVQVINITAIVAIVMLTRRSNRICPYHLRSDLGESVEVEKVNDHALSNRVITAHDAEAEAR